MAVLEVCDLTKSYGGQQVLRGVSFCLEKGEVLSIIGSSGSGKTTLLRCLNFLETPQSGAISVNGEVLFDASQPEKYSPEAIRQKRLHFGLVFQSFNLFPQYTVLQNITLAPNLRTREQAKQRGDKASPRQFGRNEEKALELLEKVGLSDKKDSYPCQLSGGQQQRVAIARALALEPDVLCFDEPTSALDPELTGEVLRVIRALKSGETTMIVVTHEMEFAKHVSDKVIFMADGLVEASGTPEQLFGKTQNARLCASCKLCRSLKSLCTAGHFRTGLLRPVGFYKAGRLFLFLDSEKEFLFSAYAIVFR